MQIDLFTLIAQIVNFIILLVLLRIFLYKPIVNAMNEREEKIASRLEEAENKRQQAEKEMETYQQKRREINSERDEILSEAREDAEARRNELLEQARSEVDERKRQWQQAIQREKDSFLRDLQRRAGEQVIAITRQALSDLADAELEQQMVRTFIRRIETDDTELKETIGGELQTVLVYSTFALSDQQRRQIQNALDELLPPDTSLEFQVDSDMICGVALRTNGYRIGWNLQQYLQGLETSIRERLNEQTQQEEPDTEAA